MGLQQHHETHLELQTDNFLSPHSTQDEYSPLLQSIAQCDQEVLNNNDAITGGKRKILNWPAMNSTKRKFNALLSSIGSSSTDDLNTSKQARTSYSATPRTTLSARLGIPRSTFTSRTAQVEKMSMADLRAAGLATRRMPGAKIDEKESKPTYLPSDREAFLERLETYRNISDWMPKPDSVNEVEWAKRGWVCTKNERVRCVTCNVEIMVKLNKQDGKDGKTVLIGQASGIGMVSRVSSQAEYIANRYTDEALVKRYEDLLITSHAENCPWRQRGCDTSIFHQTLYPVHITLNALKSRYHSFLPMSDKLPSQKVFKLPLDFDFDDIISQLPPSFLMTDSERANAESATEASIPALNRVALLLALFGFKARPDYVPKLGSANCKVCFRNIGLWLHRPKEIVNEDGTPGRKSPVVPTLVPLECHRSYCPWVNAASQNPEATGKEAKPIWKILVDILEKESKARKEGADGLVRSETVGTMATTATDGSVGDDDYEKQKSEKDKERWARLRRVKSIFEPKGKKIPAKK